MVFLKFYIEAYLDGFTFGICNLTNGLFFSLDLQVNKIHLLSANGSPKGEPIRGIGFYKNAGEWSGDRAPCGQGGGSPP